MNQCEEKQQLRILVGVIVGIIVTLATVGGVGAIPVMYYIVLGWGIGAVHAYSGVRINTQQWE